MIGSLGQISLNLEDLKTSQLLHLLFPTAALTSFPAARIGENATSDTLISPELHPLGEAPDGVPLQAPAQPLQGPAAGSSSSHPTPPAGASAALHPGSSCLGHQAPRSLLQPDTPQRRKEEMRGGGGKGRVPGR
jgi:hypothetical protein